MTKVIYLRVSDELHGKVKAAAIKEGEKICRYVIKQLESAMYSDEIIEKLDLDALTRKQTPDAPDPTQQPQTPNADSNPAVDAGPQSIQMPKGNSDGK